MGTGGSTRTWQLVAIVAGLLAALLAIAVPFLPVQQRQSSFDWPQGQAANITAPLVSYSPVDLDATVPCAALTGGTPETVLSTVPRESGQSLHYGLAVFTTAERHVQIVQRDKLLLDKPVAELPPGCAISIASTSKGTTVTVGDIHTTDPGDSRPQLVGLFTDLANPAAAGLHAHVQIDSRFTTSPGALKLAAIVGAFVLTVLALFALYRLDGPRRSRGGVRRLRSWRPKLVDFVVVGTLVLWYFIGAGTSDDGYIYAMARTSGHAQYLANYFAYFGVPETPIGIPYDSLFALLSRVSTASIVVRLPELIFGIVCWFLISRTVVPRLGVAARTQKAALWTGGLMLLAFWLPYNNGLRPEPAVALGLLLTWVLIERSVASRRLLPAVLALIVAALAIVSNPSGLICLAAIFAAARPLTQIAVARARQSGWLAVAGPVLAAGLVILPIVFAGQPFAEVRAMQQAHKVVGPDNPWYTEYVVYQELFMPTPDGSLARRFAMLMMFLALAISVVVMLKHSGRIPGLSAGPTRRLLGTTIAVLPLMSFSPTKFTHHLGVFAGIGGAVAVVGAVAAGPAVIRGLRNRLLVLTAVLAVLALSFSATNGWWYVASYKIPWWDKPISVHGIVAGTGFLVLAFLALAAAGWVHVRSSLVPAGSRAAGSGAARSGASGSGAGGSGASGSGAGGSGAASTVVVASGPDGGNHRAARRWQRTVPMLAAPLALVVLFEVASFVKAAVQQYPAFSVAKSNLAALAGRPCGLANDVLVEPDPNAGMLHPVSGNAATALGEVSATGFTPNGLNLNDLTPDASAAAAASVGQSLGSSGTTTKTSGDESETGDGSPAGINGSVIPLPFGLNPATTPMLGTYANPGIDKHLISGWYRLPDGGDRNGIVAVAAAGRIASIDLDGLPVAGEMVRLQAGVQGPDGQVRTVATLAPDDVSVVQPSWRNLRFPLKQIPPNANVVRIEAKVSGTDPKEWVAVTPPRVPRTTTLQDLVGSTQPVLLDWVVGLQFPCQQPMPHRDGVAELPKYRITPEFGATIMTTNWQSHASGGPLGYVNLLVRPDVLPTYLKDDWKRDWGSLLRLDPLVPSAQPANLDVHAIERSGLWKPGPINFGIR